MKLLALDRGNDSLKAGLYDGDRLVWTGSSRGAGPDEVRGLLEGMSPSGAAISSVVPEFTDSAGRMLEESLPGRVVTAGAESPWPFRIELADRGGVGADRLCAAAGAVSESGAASLVVVDAGTAVTVDIVADGAFVGGTIFPGPSMMLGSLHAGTAALPLVDEPDSPPDFPGGDTAAAIRAGVWLASAGAVREIVARALEDLPEGSPVFLTGGGSRSARSVLEGRAIIRPSLVMDGLKWLYHNEIPE